MENLLNKFHREFSAHFYVLQSLENTTPKIHPDLQKLLDKHHYIFETPNILPHL